MKKQLLVSFCILMQLIAGCSPGVESGSLPTQVGEAQASRNSITLRVDWIKIQGQTGDLVGKGELYFDLMVIRQNGDSRQLRAPGEGSYKITKQSSLQMDGFSLNINNIQPGEKILVFFTAFDSDEPDYLTNKAASIGLDGAMAALGSGLDSGKIFGKAITHASLLTFVLGEVTGIALDWWKQADILGGHAVVLSPSNVWMAGHSYEALSDNGVLTIHYSVIASDADAINQLAVQESSTIATAEGLSLDHPISTPVTINNTSIGNCFAWEDENNDSTMLTVGATAGTRSEVKRKGSKYLIKPTITHDDDQVSTTFYTLQESGEFELEVFDKENRILLRNYEFSLQPDKGKIIYVHCDMLSKSTFLPNLEVSYRDEFNDPSLPEAWGSNTESNVSVVDGSLHLVGNKEGTTDLILIKPITTYHGYLVEFKFNDSALFYIDIWLTEHGVNLGQVGLTGNHYLFQSAAKLSPDAELTIEPMKGQLQVMANEWYFMEILLEDTSTCEMRIWRQDSPEDLLIKQWQLPENLANKTWLLGAYVFSEGGILDIDYVEVLESR